MYGTSFNSCNNWGSCSWLMVGQTHTTVKQSLQLFYFGMELCKQNLVIGSSLLFVVLGDACCTAPVSLMIPMLVTFPVPNEMVLIMLGMVIPYTALCIYLCSFVVACCKLDIQPTNSKVVGHELSSTDGSPALYSLNCHSFNSYKCKWGKTCIEISLMSQFHSQ